MLQISSSVVRAYIEESDTAWNGPDRLPQSLPYMRATAGVAEPANWNAFLKEIKDHLDRGSMSESQLAGLKESAEKRQTEFHALLRRRTAQEIFEILEKDPHFPRERFQSYIDDLRPPDWLLTQRASLEAALDMVLSRESTFEMATIPGRVGLGELVYLVEAIQVKEIGGGAPIHLEIDGFPTDIEPKKWFQLVKEGKLQLTVERFIRENQDARSAIFFTKAGSYQDVVMKPATASDFLFPGRGKVDGIAPAPHTSTRWRRSSAPTIGASAWRRSTRGGSQSTSKGTCAARSSLLSRERPSSMRTTTTWRGGVTSRAGRARRTCSAP